MLQVPLPLPSLEGLVFKCLPRSRAAAGWSVATTTPRLPVNFVPSSNVTSGGESKSELLISFTCTPTTDNAKQCQLLHSRRKEVPAVQSTYMFSLSRTTAPSVSSVQC